MTGAWYARGICDPGCRTREKGKCYNLDGFFGAVSHRARKRKVTRDSGVFDWTLQLLQLISVLLAPPSVFRLFRPYSKLEVYYYGASKKLGISVWPGSFVIVNVYRTCFARIIFHCYDT